MLARIFAAILLIFVSQLSKAASAPPQFNNEVQREAFVTLTQELRCPKCQNQNLADSDSEIAEVMRDVVAEKLIAGNTSKEIKTMMVDRYGDFVLYKPPVTMETLLLWWSPAILFGIAGLVFFFIVRKRLRVANQEKDTPIDNEDS